MPALTSVKQAFGMHGTIAAMDFDPAAADDENGRRCAVARQRVEALRERLARETGEPVRLVETHISWVLLGARHAYKLKKPLRLPFLDFSTLQARRRCCEEELRLNRRLAPGLYLDVRDVREGPSGPFIGGGGSDGAGTLVDAAVRMLRFPDGALWSEQLAAGTLRPADVDAFARRLCAFHRDAAHADGHGACGLAPVRERIARGIVDAIDAAVEGAVHASRGGAPPAGALSDPQGRWPALRAWLLEQTAALAPFWLARRNAGRVRECHGDLHLDNVLQLDGQPAAFDGIEFDPELRWIDVLDDAAFLAMDLLAHGHAALAWRFVNAVLEEGGDYDGLPGLRYWMVCRALVRAQVLALREAQQRPAAGVDGDSPDAGPSAQAATGSAAGSSGAIGSAAAAGSTAGPTAGQSSRCDAAGYLALAAALAHGRDARLAITHGLPGSGKTWASGALVEAAGAARVRSDVERKRLFGLDALADSHAQPGGIYDDTATARTYARLDAVARTALASGWPVVVDAAFLRRDERARFAALAAGFGAPFAILDCRAPHALLRERIARRRAQGRDASEADEAVLERLAAAAEPLDAHERAHAIDVDAAQPVDGEAIARRWRSMR